MIKAIETTATFNADQHLELDDKLPLKTSERVRVIILFDQFKHESGRRRRKSGTAAGQIIMSDDFDAEIVGFEEYMP